MKITIIGVGHIGGTLGQKWAKADHEIVFGVRDPKAKRDSIKFEPGQVPIEFAEILPALDQGEVAVIAIPGQAAAQLAADHAPAFDGKIVIDASNNLMGDQMSCLGALQEGAPKAMLFRAFNSLGWEVFAQPAFDGQSADLLYCGADDIEAQRIVENLIADVGLRPVRVGDLDHLNEVDGLVRVWLALARNLGHGRHMAFKVLADEPL